LITLGTKYLVPYSFKTAIERNSPRGSASIATHKRETRERETRRYSPSRPARIHAHHHAPKRTSTLQTPRMYVHNSNHANQPPKRTSHHRTAHAGKKHQYKKNPLANGYTPRIDVAIKFHTFSGRGCTCTFDQSIDPLCEVGGELREYGPIRCVHLTREIESSGKSTCCPEAFLCINNKSPWTTGVTKPTERIVDF